VTPEPFEAADVLGTRLPPPSDRMLTTCFLAALFHGIVILGVTFSAPRSNLHDSDAELQVVLVNDQVPAAAQNPHAQYLSERTQLGSGNTAARDRTLIPKSSLSPLDRPGVPGGEGLAAQVSGADAGDDELIASQRPAHQILYFASAGTPKQVAQPPLLLEKRPDLGMAPNDDGVELRMRGETKSALWIAADTRQSDVAAYLDSWRRKIERVGTVNFPDAARRRHLSGTPVVEVIIGADGRLLDSEIKHTSGFIEIDEAALRILKLAAPFDPFPSELTAKHDQIRIAYEWEFLNGASEGTSVYFPEQGH
jgi:protein TonB